MKTRAVLGIMLTLLLIMLALAFNIQPTKAGSTTIYVDDDNASGPWDGTREHPYQNITSGIEHAATGDTIFVYNGTYYENVVVDKIVSLVGENSNITIIDGSNGYGTTVKISVNKVKITGFTIRTPAIRASIGILVLYSEGVQIYNNKIVNNGEGVKLVHSNESFVENNVMDLNYYCDVSLEASNHNTIKENYMLSKDAEHGIDCGGDGNIVINNNLFEIYLGGSGNILRDNIVNSIFLSGDRYSTLVNNTVRDGKVGIYLSGSCYATLLSNRVENCSEYGIYLSGSYNTLKNNNMRNNKYDFIVNGWEVSGFMHDVDTSNTVNGEPVYYLVNQSNLIVDSSNFPNPGYLAVVNSINVTVRNLKLVNKSAGLLLGFTNGSFIQGNDIRNNQIGIDVVGSKGNTISANNLTSNDWMGVGLRRDSSNNVMVGNIVTSNGMAIWLFKSGKNTICSNSIQFNGVEIFFDEGSETNIIYHNNFIDNKLVVSNFWNATNSWDDGYPSGGNYWIDYNGTDLYSGPFQNVTGSDGIGDSPYVIDANNTDRFPLMSPFIRFDAGTWNGISYDASVVSNSTVSDFYFNPDEGAFIRFNVSGPDGTTGFCRVAIPKQLLSVDRPEEWIVMVGNDVVVPEVSEDENYTYLYFTYPHSTKTVIITGTRVIPEFPSWTQILLILILLSIAIAIYKRKLVKTPIH